MPPTTTQADPSLDPRVDAVLERAAAYYERCLWESGVTGSIRELLEGRGIDEALARAFQIGYAPDDGHALLDELAAEDLDGDALVAAGVAQRSGRGRLHALFRSRIMFLVREADGRPLGFAGRATNPGPSWPLWTTAPDTRRFMRSQAVFGLDRARDAIRREREAVVCDDCIEAIRLHAAGRSAAVAVVRSQIAPGHIAAIASAMGVDADELGWSDDDKESSVRAVLVPGRGARPDPDAPPPDTEPRVHEGGIVPDPVVVRSTPVQIAIQVSRALIGAGVPLAWLAFLGFDRDATESSTTFVGAVGGVALTYMVMTLVAAVVSGRARARSRARRMRGPWERGATEWQPPAWTYHLFEDVMVGAAIFSVFVCTVMFFTIGGFID